MNAVLLIDIQNDFLPSGALPVPDGDAVVNVQPGDDERAFVEMRCAGVGLITTSEFFRKGQHL